MAYTNTFTASSARFGGLQARIDALRASYAKWRVFRTTLSELSSLSDRDLADLGLARGMINSVAYEAAYGK